MQTPITYVYGLTLLPHMQNSAQKEWVQMLRWLAMRCNSKLQIRARMWKRKSEVAGMSANLSRSPSGQEAFSSWNCNLHIIFRSALQQKKNWNSSPTPSKKKKKHTPDSANLKLLILQEREREFHVSSSSLLKVHDHNLLLGKKIH